jgi:hypothetical protein
LAAWVIVALVPTLLVRAPAARAQSLGTAPPPLASGYREYLALLGTPIASLPPLATYTVLGAAQMSPQLVARYGFISDITQPLAPETGGHAAHSLDTFAMSGIMSTGLGGTVSGTVGISNEQCSGCSGSSFMASIGGDYRIITTAIKSGPASRLTVAANGEIGFGNPAAGATWTADLGFPLALNVGDGGGTSIIPFLTPSVAFLSARADSGSTLRAGRVLIGAGVALYNPKSSFSANFGLQYVFVSHTQVELGVAVTIGGR